MVQYINNKIEKGGVAKKLGSTINSVGGLKIYFHYFLFKNKKLVTK